MRRQPDHLVGITDANQQHVDPDAVLGERQNQSLVAVMPLVENLIAEGMEGPAILGDAGKGFQHPVVELRRRQIVVDLAGQIVAGAARGVGACLLYTSRCV